MSASRPLKLAGLALALPALAWQGSALLLAQSPEEPQRRPDAKANECTACHGNRSPLPKDHARTAKLSLQDCRGCHSKGSAMDLAGKLPLSHTHLLSGVACAQCHADPNNAQPAGFKTCLQCHDMDKVAAATKAVKPTNPHTSPHYGKEADCNLCHHQHEKSENYCLQCHKFAFHVP